MPKKHRKTKLDIIVLQASQWCTIVITQLVSLNSCGLVFVILVTRMK